MPAVEEIFSVRYGHSLELNRLARATAPEGVNFIGRTMQNNGVTARVQLPEDVSPGLPGELTVALNGNGVLSTFVQPEPFVCAYHVAILKSIDPDMGLREKLWWARCILANRYRFSYGRQANRSLGSLQLPKNVPNFVNSVVVPDFSKARSALSSEVELPDVSRWAEWRLEELFDVKKGTRITKRCRQPGSTPFVGASTKNNGVTDYVDAEPSFSHNSITVPYNGNGVAYAMVQRNAFCASDDVQVLVPRTEVCLEALLFVCTVIRGERYRFSYGRKWHLERMRKSTIRLPGSLAEGPDWGSMRSYVRGLPYAAGAFASN